MSKTKSKKVIQVTAGTLCILCLLGLAIGFGIYGIVEAPRVPFGPPSASLLGKYKTAAVSSDGVPCSDIGKDVLLEGGNAVDAAIATLFCIGAVNPQSAGLGGGFFMTIFDPVAGTATALDARETAPFGATENMFNGDSSLSQKGGLSVAVPGELAGYWKAHQRYGKLPWSRLIMPTVVLAELGVVVNRHLANALQEEEAIIKAEPSMWYFLNEETGEVKKEGEIFRRPAFAQTLRDIAQYGADVFYRGFVGDRLVSDIQRRGGLVNQVDLVNYEAKWVEPVKVTLRNKQTLYSTPPPGSGVLVSYILNILDSYQVEEGAPRDDMDPLFYHRMTEAFKHAYAQRTKLADPDYEPEVVELAMNLTSEAWALDTRMKINDSSTSNDTAYYGAVTYSPEDKGTSHVSVLDGNGMAVSVTSTVNLYFGAGFTSEQTGIIPNDEMDDFSSPNVTNFFGVPPSPANFIKAGKRPLSSIAASILVGEEGKVSLVLGSAGGTKITTAVAYALIQNKWFGKDIKESIDRSRMHHQLWPTAFQYETGFPLEIVEFLKTRGHAVSEYQKGTAMTGISVESDGYIYANSDYRKGGNVAGID